MMKKIVSSLLIILALLPSVLVSSYAIDSADTSPSLTFGSISELIKYIESLDEQQIAEADDSTKSLLEYLYYNVDGLYLPTSSDELTSDEISQIIITSECTDMTIKHNGITMHLSCFGNNEPSVSGSSVITFTYTSGVSVYYCYSQGYHCYYWCQDDQYFLLSYKGTHRNDCLLYCNVAFYTLDELKVPDVSYSASDGKVTITWNVDVESEYTIYYKRSNSDEWKLLASSTKKKVNITGLQNGKRYDFKVEVDGMEVEVVTAVPHAGDEIMLSVPEYCQYPDYPTGCECSALYMLLLYYDVDVTMKEIVDVLPKGPLPYEDPESSESDSTEEEVVLYGANPEREFVGDPTNWSSYGVYNEPIRETAEVFRSGAISVTGATIDDIKEIIASGNPVIAWFTSNLEVGVEYRRSWLDYETGELVQWLSYEHAVVVYGISDELVYYNDPQTGSGRSLDIETFTEMFQLFGSRIVYYQE